MCLVSVGFRKSLSVYEFLRQGLYIDKKSLYNESRVKPNYTEISCLGSKEMVLICNYSLYNPTPPWPVLPLGAKGWGLRVGLVPPPSPNISLNPLQIWQQQTNNTIQTYNVQWNNFKTRLSKWSSVYDVLYTSNNYYIFSCTVQLIVSIETTWYLDWSAIKITIQLQTGNFTVCGSSYYHQIAVNTKSPISIKITFVSPRDGFINTMFCNSPWFSRLQYQTNLQSQLLLNQMMVGSSNGQ